MGPKKALLAILGVCILVICGFFTRTCTGIGGPSGLQALAVPLDSGGGEPAYALQFPLICYGFLVAIILLLVLLFISTKQVLELGKKSK